MRKVSILIIILILISLIVVYSGFIEKAAFINVMPSIKMRGIEYVVTQDTLSRDNVGIPFGIVTQVVELVSFSDNPYKNPKWIYRIKNKDIEEEVALEMNSKLYICRFYKYISSP